MSPQQAAAAYCGEFARLSGGMTHYRWDGPADGATLLLIHGATVPMWQFNRVVPLFNAAGLRTLRLDLFGHGLSGYPRVAYTPQLFARQIKELLDALAVRAPLRALGHSMGAAVLARLAAARPEQFRALVLVAPLLDYTAVNRNARLLRAPLLGEVLMRYYAAPMLIRRRRRRYRPLNAEPLAELFREQFKRGHGRALLSMLRDGALADQSDAYRALAATGGRVLLLRGGLDDVAPAEQVDTLRSLLPASRYQELAGLEHNLMISEPRRAAAPALAFFR